jgi:hypothetical protein
VKKAKKKIIEYTSQKSEAKKKSQKLLNARGWQPSNDISDNEGWKEKLNIYILKGRAKEKNIHIESYCHQNTHIIQV